MFRFLVALWWIRIEGTAAEAPKRRNFSTDFKEGVSHSATHSAIGVLLLLLLTAIRDWWPSIECAASGICSTDFQA